MFYELKQKFVEHPFHFAPILLQKFALFALVL